MKNEEQNPDATKAIMALVLLAAGLYGLYIALF